MSEAATTKVLFVRMSPALHARVAARAEAAGEKMAHWAIGAIEAVLEADEQQDRDDAKAREANQ